MKAMISSTMRDLPTYRAMAKEACLEACFQPIMSEYVLGPGRPSENISAGLVDDALVYIVILAHAYGSSPDN